MKIPGLGSVTVDVDYDGYRSLPLVVPVLGNASCQLVVLGYDGEERQDDFHAAIGAFLALDESVLRAAAVPVFEYYLDVRNGAGADELVSITDPDAVWDHVRPGNDVVVQRDGRVYISVECECAWELEHGLQIVFREGRSVTKVGPFDGHLTNASAFARDDLEDVVYHRVG